MSASSVSAAINSGRERNVSASVAECFVANFTTSRGDRSPVVDKCRSMGPSATTVPALFVTKTSNQTVAASTATKVTFNSVVIDSNSNWDAGNNRFQPTVPGIYIMTVGMSCGTETSYCNALLYKNGTLYVTAQNNSSNAGKSMQATAVVSMNGTTDYVEAWGFSGGGTQFYGATSGFTYLSGVLVSMAGGVGGGTTTLSALSDVNTSGASTGSILAYNGSQ